MKIILHIIVILLLTALTQIGGLIYLITILVIKKNTNKKRTKRLGLFAGLYLFTTFLIIPQLAPLFGREKIKESNTVKAHSFFYKLANRNYVRPQLNLVLTNIGTKLAKKHSDIKLVYLDANFPFFKGFPLLPHLSHNDGKKVDVSLVYKNPNGQLTNKKPSVSGYGAYEGPTAKEYDQITVCKQKDYWQYDFPKYMTLGTIHKDIRFSEKGTRSLANFIVKENEVGKLFIEPHLKNRLQLTSAKVRFHGCQAGRHDDHIHFQLK